MMTCLALIFSYVESLIPIPIPIPGIKLGLANLLTVILLYAVGPWEAFAVNVVRVVLSGFLFGSLFAILYSLAGCAVSFLAMAALKKSGRFSAVGVSIAGGSAHNIGPDPCGGSGAGQCGFVFLCSGAADCGRGYRPFDWVSRQERS